MNAQEAKAIHRWNAFNSGTERRSQKHLNKICDLGAKCDPDGTRYCSLDYALEQIFEYGTKDDFDAAICELGHYWHCRGRFDCMMSLSEMLKWHTR